MIIDVLSPDTVKVTLNVLDMNDYDIRYENLSQKNAETKRMLAGILKTLREEKPGVSGGLCGIGALSPDFSGERLFVEAFPRPDGGCMLYISALPEVGDGAKKRTKRFLRERGGLTLTVDGIKMLEGLVRALNFLQSAGRLRCKSALYQSGSTYRLVLTGVHDSAREAVTFAAGEYLGEVGDSAEPPEGFREIAATGALEVLRGIV